VGRPQTLGFQADMAHTMLFTMGYNAPEDRLVPDDFDWTDSEALAAAYRKMAGALRPWTIDFHVAQNDGTVKGAGSHDKTGRHCQPADPNGKLDIVRDAVFDEHALGITADQFGGRLTPVAGEQERGFLVPEIGDGQLPYRPVITGQVNGLIEDAWCAIGAGDVVEFDTSPGRERSLVDVVK